MSKEIPKVEQQSKQEKAQEEPVFATPEELKKKEELLKSLKEAEKDESIEGLEKQDEIYSKLEQLDKEREERIAREKGGEIYDKEKEIFENIRFKETPNKKTDKISYISRHQGRQMVILVKNPLEEVELDRPYKARVIKRDDRFIYVRIIE